MSQEGGKARVTSNQEKEAPDLLFPEQHRPCLQFSRGLVGARVGLAALCLGLRPVGPGNQGSIRASCRGLHSDQGGSILPRGLARDLPP